MKPALVYIAGAYRARTPWDVESNVRAAESMALCVASMGAVPVCVHSMYRYFDRADGLSALYWLEGTLEIMRRCDAVLVLRGRASEESEGTKGEIEEAKRLGLPIFASPMLLSEWLEANYDRFKVLR